MATIPTTEPERFTAGDTVTWKRRTEHLGDHLDPAAGWTLTYRISRDRYAYTVTGSDNGDGYHLISIAKATTGAYEPGDYHWQATVDDGTSRYTVGTGRLQILPDFATEGANLDTRTESERWLESLISARERLLDNAARAVTVSDTNDGRSRSYRTLDELDAAIDRARARVTWERRRRRGDAGRSHSGLIRVRL